MSDSIVNFRVDTDLKNAFELAAKKADQTISQMLRAYMRETVAQYMTTNAQGSLLEAKKPAKSTKVSTKAKKQPKSGVGGFMGKILERGM